LIYEKAITLTAEDKTVK